MERYSISVNIEYENIKTRNLIIFKPVNFYSVIMNAFFEDNNGGFLQLVNTIATAKKSLKQY